jgi:hypothetical protein
VVVEVADKMMLQQLELEELEVVVLVETQV